jgi:hypothetical protein
VSPPVFVKINFVPTTEENLSSIIMDYNTGLLNAVERSVHLHGLFTTSPLLSIIDRFQGNKGLFASNDVFGSTPQVSYL